MNISVDNPRVDAIRQRLSSSYNELNHMIEGPLTSLDTAKLYEAPIEGEWTLMQNLSHIVELLPYWADEIAKLVALPGQNFGRTQQHEGRLRAIQEHGTDSLEQIRSALPESVARLEQVLDTLKDSDLDLTAHHVRFNDQTLDWYIKEFVTDHLANHLTQIKAVLAAF